MQRGIALSGHRDPPQSPKKGCKRRKRGRKRKRRRKRRKRRRRKRKRRKKRRSGGRYLSKLNDLQQVFGGRGLVENIDRHSDYLLLLLPLLLLLLLPLRKSSKSETFLLYEIH